MAEWVATRTILDSGSPESSVVGPSEILRIFPTSCPNSTRDSSLPGLINPQEGYHQCPQ
ncbi:quinate permease [Aspergillus luchuensis]|uniref:Quinate permease n=1 Tax=Aspergillus kawachii TaxID=1069201 RepID=A0A146FMY1_ASPKA|nr:quinate permease [Aspergillus luchuensis]